MYEKGIVVTQDYAKANELYLKSCNANYGESCNNLAINYYKGYGLSLDTQKAKELFKKACDLKYQFSCVTYDAIIKKESK